ncbi:MAG TPA: hypothetical protein VFW28_17770 [Micropepsaceae bacterium]|nr:hypothetical protein [Micropepsaceae bacterium]
MAEHAPMTSGRNTRYMIALLAGIFGAGIWLAPVQPAAAAELSAAERARAIAKLPDWSGIWTGTGTLFDQSRGALNPNNNPMARDYPPYKPEWEAAYTKFLNEVVRTGKFTDPLSAAYPAGVPRMMTLPYGFQFVISPEMVWVVHEHPDVRYIYTDGRGFPPADELWPTFDGYSIGHWEGDTLVVQTVSMKGYVPIDRTGLAMTGQARLTERIRKTSDTTLEDVMTIEDPVALTAPWTVTRRFVKRNDKRPRMENVPDIDNQRNPLVNGETQIILESDVTNARTPYPDSLGRVAVPQYPR